MISILVIIIGTLLYIMVSTHTVITGENSKDIIGSVVCIQMTNSSGCETAHVSENVQALAAVLCTCVFAEKLISSTTRKLHYLV